MSEKKSAFISKTAKVRCRNCKELLLKQNYKNHLVRQHEGEDPNDLRGFQQQAITSLFRKGQSSASSPLKRNAESINSDKEDEIPHKVQVAEEDVVEVVPQQPHQSAIMTQIRVPREESATTAIEATLPARNSSHLHAKIDKILRKVEHMEGQLEILQPMM